MRSMKERLTQTMLQQMNAVIKDFSCVKGFEITSLLWFVMVDSEEANA